MTQRLHPASVAALLAALAASPAAFADEVLVPVPGAGWHLRMDLPSAVKPGPTPPGGLYGAGAGRFNVTAFAEEHAWCPGPETNENVYKCFAARLRANPIVDWDTERGNTMPNGVQVMYMTHAQIDGAKATAFNVDVLFPHAGKWVDVHFSVVSPTPGDLPGLLAMAGSVRGVDDGASATAPAASAR